MNRKSTTKWVTLSLTTALAIGNLSVNAETFELRMAVEAIPGAADIKRGDIDKGIRRLEHPLTESHPAGCRRHRSLCRLHHAAGPEVGRDLV